MEIWSKSRKISHKRTKTWESTGQFVMKLIRCVHLMVIQKRVCASCENPDFFGRLHHAECSKFEETDFFSFFIDADRGSCPTTPHPHECPRIPSQWHQRSYVSTVQHVHITLMMERCMGLLERHPNKCLPHECKEVLSLALWPVLCCLHMLEPWTQCR